MPVEFGANRKYSDGLNITCKACCRSAAKLQRQKHLKANRGNPTKPLDLVRCPKCKIRLPSDLFYRDRHSHNGLTTYCKPCSKAIKIEKFEAESRLKGRDIVVATRKGKYREYARISRLRHPERNKLSCKKYYWKMKATNPDKLRRQGRINSARWRDKYPERVAAIKRRFLYKLEPSQFEAMKLFQSNSCAICRSSFNTKRIHVDHDMETEKVRGLLCGTCNRGIGHFSHSIEVLKLALKYLDQPLPEQLNLRVSAPYKARSQSDFKLRQRYDHDTP